MKTRVTEKTFYKVKALRSAMKPKTSISEWARTANSLYGYTFHHVTYSRLNKVSTWEEFCKLKTEEARKREAVYPTKIDDELMFLTAIYDELKKSVESCMKARDIIGGAIEQLNKERQSR